MLVARGQGLMEVMIPNQFYCPLQLGIIQVFGMCFKFTLGNFPEGSGDYLKEFIY